MYQSFEARNIPDVQECVRQHVDRKKDVWGLHEILNTFAMHPEGDDHSNKECHNIDLRVHLVFGAVLVELCDKVEDPGLVGDGIDFGGEAEDGKPYGSVGQEDAHHTQQCSNMMPSHH